ncbi:MAG: class I SAM-dependent methyltransferase [Acidimicrobiia bacterium]|jgi:8-oxo-dGTP pyrophosphatase MutT (NUDIX family)|nr:class I SAM-dependent methyltransferase [Acidimicrobiia bacterium]
MSHRPAGEPSDGEADTPAGAVLGDSVLQSSTLESVASATRYHDWLTALARPHLGDHPIELGSGLGDYADRWLKLGVPRITVTDLDPDRLTVLRERFATNERVEVLGLDVFDPPARQHSCFVAFNVLEHIPDHVGALTAAHQLVAPGGAVVMFVPAFMFAMSDFDRRVGHVRRYRLAGLREAYEQAGLTVERLHYVNAPGLPAWFVAMRLLRSTPGDGALVRTWDRLVIPLARRLERRRFPPFGQSAFAVGRVPLG